jgi:sugar lactone lactonase YvrE
MATTTVDVLLQRSDRLGECPLWDERERALYWVDIRAPALHRCEPGRRAVETWPLPETVGSIALRAPGGFVLALQSGIYRVDRPGDPPALIVEPEPERPSNRLNDGRCDPAGRFWVGSMNELSRDPLGRLFRIGPDGRCTRALDDILIPNSLAWSPDGCTMYFADTLRSTIWAFDYDPPSGEMSNRRIFRDMRDHPGHPDGSAVDVEGCLWNCEYGGWRVVRYRPNGEIDRAIRLPVSQPTCCCFGDADLRTLYVTSASQQLSPEQLAQQPLAGSVFAIRLDVAGLPEHRFAA